MILYLRINDGDKGFLLNSFFCKLLILYSKYPIINASIGKTNR